MNYTRIELIENLINAIKEEDNTDPYEVSGTWSWVLNTDDKRNNWAIVLGWRDGHDENDHCCQYSVGEYHLCAKLAYQPSNSIMQCDYDIDWTMPYNEETGDVDDNEVYICCYDDAEDVVNWLLKVYRTYFEC